MCVAVCVAVLRHPCPLSAPFSRLQLWVQSCRPLLSGKQFLAEIRFLIDDQIAISLSEKQNVILQFRVPDCKLDVSCFSAWLQFGVPESAWAQCGFPECNLVVITTAIAVLLLLWDSFLAVLEILNHPDTCGKFTVRSVCIPMTHLIGVIKSRPRLKTMDTA